jgi:hypothetical protein
MISVKAYQLQEQNQRLRQLFQKRGLFGCEIRVFHGAVRLGENAGRISLFWVPLLILILLVMGERQQMANALDPKKWSHGFMIYEDAKVLF